MQAEPHRNALQISLITALAIAVCGSGCVSISFEHSSSRKAKKVSVSDFKDVAFVHEGKSYSFELSKKPFGNSVRGIVYWIPEAEVLIPNGELGGPLYSDREPIAGPSHTFRVTNRSTGYYGSDDFYIDPNDVADWIQSQYPGARRRPIKTFEEIREAIREESHP